MSFGNAVDFAQSNFKRTFKKTSGCQVIQKCINQCKTFDYVDDSHVLITPTAIIPLPINLPVKLTQHLIKTVLLSNKSHDEAGFLSTIGGASAT